MHALPSVVAAGLAFWLTGAVLGAASFTVGSANHQQTQLLFSDDFENGTHRWTIFDSTNIRVVASGDAARGNVLELAANGALTRAVIRGSRQWRRVVVEGEMMFPDCRRFDHARPC